MAAIPLLTDLDVAQFETMPIFKKLVAASRTLADLRGVALLLPNPHILINALGLQEAKDSSAIENIVTTHDDLFKDAADDLVNSAAKEVLRYRQALYLGFEQVQKTDLLTMNNIENIQQELLLNDAGFRKQADTTLKNNLGETVYTPPQDWGTIIELMRDLEKFINNSENLGLDPLIKMALIHHQFESIHPFYDGNGRTGRIINVLYLVKEKLLDTPILYLSSYILRTKKEYYRLLKAVRDKDAWQEWVLYILTGIEETANEAIITINAIHNALLNVKKNIRENYKFYSQDLMNNLFTHPYTKIEFLERDLKVSRLTATRYLDLLAKNSLLIKQKIGRENYYINKALYDILKNL